MRVIRRAALLLSLVLATLAHGATEAPTDEVVVQASRAKLTKLAKEIEEAEVKFYQRYNELNTERDYAINCYTEQRRNSHFTARYCQPMFETKAIAEESRAFVQGLKGMSSIPVPTPSALRNATPAFQKHVIEVTQKSPDLIRMLTEHAALVRRYQDMYGALNGMKTESK